MGYLSWYDLHFELIMIQAEERRWVRANLFPQFLLTFHLAEFDAADLA